MALRITHPVAILNIVELVLSIIIVGLIANLGCLACSGNVYKSQFVDAIVFGYLIVNILVTTAVFIPGNFDKTLRLTITGSGSGLYSFTAWLLSEDASQLHETRKDDYMRFMVAGGVALCVVIVFGLDFVYVAKYHHTDEEEEEESEEHFPVE